MLALAIGIAGCGKKTPEIPDLDFWEALEGSGQAGGLVVDATRDAFNPLTGISDMPRDRVGMRPLAVSVNNISMSWPQYGVSDADIVYEIETEGGITRLMCVYSDLREINQIGSVRSLRDQFMNCTFPYDALIVHIGTSIYADQEIAKHNYRTLDGNLIWDAIFTDSSRSGSYAPEHTKFTSGSAVYAGIEKAGLKMESNSDIAAFNFREVGDTFVPTGGDANQITFLYSNKTYDGDFRYDEASGKYLKFQRGKEHMDAGNDTQLAFDNVFLLFANVSQRGTTELIEVDYAAGGTGYYFTQGRYVEFEWTKPDYSTNFSFTDKATGEELSINTGKSMVAVVRNDNMDTLEIV